ncbi:MAG: hypothetical protein PVI30_01780 [Myxococcales bacterium]|jgi:predicted Zn-dependent peptidase
MPRAPHILAVVLAVGCASAPRPPPEPRVELVSQPTGIDLAVRARPAAGVVQLSLFVDAGARDADPPQLAALAAELAARRAGPGVRGRAWPDALELSARCRARDLRRCVERLARGLAARGVSGEQHAELRLWLTRGRRRARARDPRLRADRLALGALFGAEDAAHLLPLGSAEDDDDASAEALADFLSRHLGPERALLTASGNVDVRELRQVAEHAFAANPTASSPRAAPAALSAEDGLEVDVGDREAVSLALWAPTLRDAATAAMRIRRRLRRNGALGVHGHAFRLGGGGAALLRVDGGEPRRLVTVASHEAGLLRLEAGSREPHTTPADGLGEELHRLGMRWAARDPVADPSASPRLGIGVLVAGGRADRPREDDPDARTRQAARETLQHAMARGRAATDPKLTGEVNEAGSAVTLDNGARVAVRAAPGPRVAVAVRFADGAGSDPPLHHGRSALLATLLTSSCGGRGARLLSDDLVRLGAELSPRVSAGSWGFVLEAPREHVAGAIDLALECALWGAPSMGDLARARMLLRKRLSGRAAELRAHAAAALRADAPGSIAPWGRSDASANTSYASVRAALRRAIRGRALAVGVTGDAAVEAATLRVARRLSLLPQRSAEPAPVESPASGAVAAPLAEVPRPTRGLLLWRVAAGGGDPAGARAFAALVAAGLARLPAVHAVWHDGGMDGGEGWAAVALTGEPDALHAVYSTLSSAPPSVDRDHLGEVAERLREQERAERGAREARAVELADRLARTALGDAPSPPGDPGSARRLARALADAQPAWHPLR